MCEVAAAGNGGSAAEGLEFHIGNGVVLGVDADLELHDITASGCTDETCADIEVVLRHRTDVSGVAVVVKQWETLAECPKTVDLRLVRMARTSREDSELALWDDIGGHIFLVVIPPCIHLCRYRCQSAG